MTLILHRSLPQEAPSLYRLIARVVAHLKQESEEYEKICFSGKLKILAAMQNLLDLYCLEEDRLFHVSQAASKAMLDAIQLMRSPVTTYTRHLSLQLKQFTLKVVQYGMPEQHQLWGRFLEKYLEQDESFFLPIFSYYQKHLKDKTQLLSQQQLCQNAAFAE